MDILFVADSLADFKIDKDSTFAMMQEAVKQGNRIFHVLRSDLQASGSLVIASAVEVALTGHTPEWFTVAEPKERALNAFDVVIMRTDPPFNLEYLYTTQLFTLAEKQGAKIFNSGQALRDFNEKLAILNFSEFIAPTLITSNQDEVEAFLNKQHDVIVKPLDGMGGSGIFRLKESDPNLGSILESLTQLNTRTIMAQRYIPEINQGDKRVLVINGKVLPYALARIPKEGETRGNLAVGGQGVAQKLSARDLQIAESLAPKLKQRGIFLAGLDIIGAYLTEVNVTSPTCFIEITAQTDFNVAGFFMDELKKIIA